jgi:hypothetical protein
MTASRRHAGAPPVPADDGQGALGGGLSLSLPYVPARLVIEVSGPAGQTALLASHLVKRVTLVAHHPEFRPLDWIRERI